MLDIADRLIVIIGGGNVAARKAAGALDAGAKHVRCVAPHFCDELPDTVERIRRGYCSGDLAGAGLVFAATDDRAVNDAVVRDARAMGVLMNRADGNADEPGDFSTPAKFTEGSVIITVSAGSAALSAAIRDDLARRLDRRFVRMADAMQLLRPAVRASRLAPDRRAQVFRDLAGDDALNILEADGMDALRGWLQSRHPELTHA
ncbi:MAG TPA: NAD(P)-dependent oxidoreductase [Tepidisphaeraceae bacterium]|nr:NAD(P)-dependent oxidoreductase [Tepidisphaeraceae bacterium]